MTLYDTTDHSRHYVEPRRGVYVVIDPGNLTDATCAAIIDHTVRGAGAFDINHSTRTIRQKRVTRFDVIGVRRLDTDLSHIEQAAKVAEWLNEPKVQQRLGEDRPRIILNIASIGRPA